MATGHQAAINQARTVERIAGRFGRLNTAIQDLEAKLAASGFRSDTVKKQAETKLKALRAERDAIKHTAEELKRVFERLTEA